MESHNKDVGSTGQDSDEASLKLVPTFPNGLTEKQEQQLLGVGIKLKEYEHYLITQFPVPVDWFNPLVHAAIKLREAQMCIAARLTSLEGPTKEELDDAIARLSADSG